MYVTPQRGSLPPLWYSVFKQKKCFFPVRQWSTSHSPICRGVCDIDRRSLAEITLTISDAGPAIKQHWRNVCCLLWNTRNVWVKFAHIQNDACTSKTCIIIAYDKKVIAFRNHYVIGPSRSYPPLNEVGVGGYWRRFGCPSGRPPVPRPDVRISFSEQNSVTRAWISLIFDKHIL